MNNLIINLYEFSTIFLPLLILFFVLDKPYKNKKYNISNIAKILVFSIYICGVFYFTGSGTIFELTRLGNNIDTSKINLIPFSRGINITEYFQNILLFMPLGFLIPLIWNKRNKLKYSLLYGFLFSLLIETSQLFNFRQSDIDDLILNTLGSLIGYIIFKLFSMIIKPKTNNLNINKYDPITYLLVMFLGHFLLYNPYGLSGLIYNI